MTGKFHAEKFHEQVFLTITDFFFKNLIFTIKLNLCLLGIKHSVYW